MATAQPTPQREKVAFEPNVPVMVTLKYAAGKEVPGRFGPQVMFTTVDNRVMFVDLAVAQHINSLEPKPGETIGICKRTRGPGVAAHWDVWLSPDTEKLRAVKETPGLTLTSAGAGARIPAPAAALAGHFNNTNATKGQGLVAETSGLVDAFAAALAYSQGKYGDRVRPEDVRALLLCAYGQRTKGGAHA